jgi:CDP-diacylglycerol--serine O-phosphatidyltransferase
MSFLKIFDRFFLSDPHDKKQGGGRNLAKLLPNIVTLGSVAAGLTAIQKAIAEQWEFAVLLILVACILDTLDGALARLLKAASKFGAELDSLSDFLSFGVAPAMILYLWVLNDAGRIGWIAGLVFVIACALRLARYNTMIEDTDDRPEWARYFFAGVPAPAGAGLVLAPMIFAFLIAQDMSSFSFATPLIGLWVLVVALLMVSRIPTFSSKQIRVPSQATIPMLGLVGLFLAALIHAPWMTLSICVTVYAVSLPLAWRIYKKRERRAAGDGDASKADE